VDTYRGFYFALDQRIQPFPGVTAALDAFQHADVPMAVVTSKIAWGATEELTSSGMLHYFHSVVGFDDTDLHQPDPAPVFEALDRLLMEASKRVVFVGDSPADIWAANNAGITSVAALWGTLDAELLLDAMPDYTAKSPGDVLAVIAGEAAAP
jgi:pyrophosphatase PpaX